MSGAQDALGSAMAKLAADLQRTESHPSFKPLRLGFTAPGDIAGIINSDEGETI